MNTPARRLHPAATAWQATDPVLAALRAARARRDQADRDIRILLAYTPADTETARHLLRTSGPPTMPATHPGDIRHD